MYKRQALLIPLALDQLLNSFMGTIDTLVVSNLGSAAISAVSLVDAINILIVQAFFALASGGTVVCSHYLGCKNEKSAKEAARQLVSVSYTHLIYAVFYWSSYNFRNAWIYLFYPFGNRSVSCLSYTDFITSRSFYCYTYLLHV